jgi:hypothetical protein
MTRKFVFTLALNLIFVPISNADPIKRIQCEKYDEQLAQKREPNKTYSSDKLEKLKFKYDVVGYGVKGRTVTTIDETPRVAIKLKEGWLLGSNMGEWGGSLVYKHGDKEDNIEDIYVFSFGYIVTAGLAHLSMDSGSIYLVTKDKNGEFKSEKLHGLSSMPSSSWLLKNKSLLINLYQGGSAILSPEGSLQRVYCTNLDIRT